MFLEYAIPMRIRYFIALLSLLAAAFFVGMRVVRAPAELDAPTYWSGMYGQRFYDAAYTKANGAPVDGVASAVVAHHLLVADAIAEVFEDIGRDDVQTVVLVSPNHFTRGVAVAQVSTGTWSTPYGDVAADVDAITALLAANTTLHHEETAFLDEHGIYGLTPFVARSFPRAKIVPIIVREDLSAAAAWSLGTAIAETLPNAVLVASVDMTHYQTADYTAANDRLVLERIDTAWQCDGAVCADNLDIDSNASMRVLFGFNTVRGASAWHLTYHGSSLAMGATADWHENTSHILGYFTFDKYVYTIDK